MDFSYLNALNPQQREAVTHVDGPLMIIAGAGSGKTKVLTTRIAHLMGAHGVDAFNILSLTFTNKAAREMKERVEKMLGNSEARNLYIGTFHSVFARILRGEATKIGFPTSFTIYDTDDAKSVVKTVIQELGLDDKHYKPNIVYNRISSAKNALVGPAEYLAEPGLALAGGMDGMDFVRQLFKDAPSRMGEQAVLVLEIGNEIDHFMAAFPELEVAWLDTTAGDDQVLLITREALLGL